MNNDAVARNTKSLHRKLNILLRTGMVLMESAADTNRIVRNMQRVAAFLGLEERYLHIDVLYGTIKVNYSDETHSFSRFMHSDKYTINMNVLSAVSRLSWRAIKEDYGIKQFERELNRIRKMKPQYPAWAVTLGTSLGCGGFSVLFGGDWASFVPATIAGAVAYVVRYFMLKRGFNFYMVTTMTSFVATLTAWLLFLVLPTGFTNYPYHSFLCCCLYLVPGVALINFLDDMLDNYLHVGLARFANGVLQIASMAFGIVLAVSISNVDNFLGDLAMAPNISYGEAAIVTAISAMGFGMNFNVPRRSLPAVAILGILGMLLRNLLAFDFKIGLILGSLAGASLISLVAVRLVHHTRTPNHVISIPGVIPMVPGILMYRGIFGFVHLGNNVEAFMGSFSNLLNAALIVLCLSIGVAIPNIFARRWIAFSRKQELHRLIEDRRRRGKFVDFTLFD